MVHMVRDVCPILCKLCLLQIYIMFVHVFATLAAEISVVSLVHFKIPHQSLSCVSDFLSCAVFDSVSPWQILVLTIL